MDSDSAHVFVRFTGGNKSQSLYIPIRVKDKMSQKATDMVVLLDSGATANLFYLEVVKEHEFRTTTIWEINIQKYQQFSH